MGYLQDIVADVRRRLEERKRELPLELVRRLPHPEPRASFAKALGRPGLGLIAEIKRVSPSKGVLRPDLVAADIATRYQRAGATAVSVLTEADHFGGSLEDLAVAVAATSVPILQKDFMVDEYQLWEARVRGASAVLLIVALLEQADLLRLSAAAADLGLDVLVEVHDEAELSRALALNDAVIGINNRDLRSFAVSLDTTFRLISLVPTDRVVVSESGLRGRDDYLRLQAAGVDGVLVGEHLLVQEDVEVAVRALLAGDVPRTVERGATV
jgi:indole-3-glycerol phosphate synthase